SPRPAATLGAPARLRDPGPHHPRAAGVARLGAGPLPPAGAGRRPRHPRPGRGAGRGGIAGDRVHPAEGGLRLGARRAGARRPARGRRAVAERARARLLDVPGIGAGTADIYLLMALRRPDVWPPGDLALQRALGRLEGLDAPVTAEAADEIAARWRPYRATA